MLKATAHSSCRPSKGGTAPDRSPKPTRGRHYEVADDGTSRCPRIHRLNFCFCLHRAPQPSAQNCESPTCANVPGGGSTRMPRQCPGGIGRNAQRLVGSKGDSPTARRRDPRLRPSSGPQPRRALRLRPPSDQRRDGTSAPRRRGAPRRNPRGDTGPPSRCAEPFEPRRDCRVHARRRRIDSATTPRERSRRQTSRDGARVGASRTRGGTFRVRADRDQEQRDPRDRSHSTHPRSVARAHRTERRNVHRRSRSALDTHRDEKRNRPRPRHARARSIRSRRPVASR